ncbi:MAG: hypothetical protein Fur0032_22730 [Terrimicrobiaceae bacterium]
MKAHENPFRSECIERLPYRFPGFSWRSLEDRLDSFGGRGAIVGPRGHGKTTLLLEWMARRKARGEAPVGLRLDYGQRRLTAGQISLLNGARMVFADSAEQLGWLGWREFLYRARHVKTLVICTHRPGRLPTIYHCRTSPELLQELAGDLAGSQTPDPQSLWKRHSGNIREALRELYDDCSRRRLWLENPVALALSPFSSNPGRTASYHSS